MNTSSSEPPDCSAISWQVSQATDAKTSPPASPAKAGSATVASEMLEPYRCYLWAQAVQFYNTGRPKPGIAGSASPKVHSGRMDLQVAILCGSRKE